MHNMGSDEAYFTARAAELEATDPDQARAWMLVAKTLFPRSFAIQFESYCLDRKALKIKESAAHLERLCYEFREEPVLWAEMRRLADALRSEDTDAESAFLREVFCHLPTDLQHRTLSGIADRSSDTLEHCQLVLLLLSRFPHMVDGHGARVVDLLLTAEKHAHCNTPMNKYRRFLVCDLLPSLLTSKSSDLTFKQLTRLFLRTVEFYVTYVTADSNKIVGNVGEASSELRLSDPWQDMTETCQRISSKLGWRLGDVFTHKRSRDLVWQQLHSFYREHAAQLEDPFVHKQLMFCTVAVMLQSLVEYTQKVDPAVGNQAGAAPAGAGPAAPGSSPGHQAALLLVEGFTEAPAAAPPSVPSPTTSRRRRSEEDLSGPLLTAGRRRRSEEDVSGPLLTVSRQTTLRPQQLTGSFLTALRCWRLLKQSPTLDKELSRVWQMLNADSWSWFKSFLTDVHLYLGDMNQLALLTSAATVSEPPGPGSNPGAASAQCKLALQRAAAAYGSHDYRLAGELCLRVLTGPLLPSVPGDPAKSQVVARCSQSRHLHFLAYNQADVSKYCIKMLTLCLQYKVLGPGGGGTSASDSGLGHLIVLLQYDWPEEEPTFAKVVSVLRQRAVFNYPQFVQYVLCPDIVEEFAYLCSEHGGASTFNLVPLQQNRQRTMATRGVDKGVREEFRQAMLQQIRRTDPIMSVTGDFLSSQAEDILRCLR